MTLGRIKLSIISPVNSRCWRRFRRSVNESWGLESNLKGEGRELQRG